jgi:hypothetical protein
MSQALASLDFPPPWWDEVTKLGRWHSEALECLSVYSWHVDKVPELSLTLSQVGSLLGGED